MPSFDVVDALPRIKAAIFADEHEGNKNPFKCGVLRCMMWTMVMWQLVLIGRGSLLSRFCPLYEDVEIPSSPMHMDADGIPKFIIITLKRW
jgi:hypothetical protein